MGRLGDDDRVVLLHGQPGNRKEWGRVVEALGPSAVALAPDRPGYGDNPLSAGGLAANVRWLIRQLDGADGPALIVGHSWAGSLALAFADTRPDLTRGLVLVSSVGPGAITRGDRVLAHPAVGAVTDRWASRGGRPARRRPATLLAFLTEQTSLVRDLPAVVDALERITTPTTVIAGTKDRIVPAATARALAARLPNAQLICVSGGGHRLHRTHPQLVAGVIRRALADSSPQ